MNEYILALIPIVILIILLLIFVSIMQIKEELKEYDNIRTIKLIIVIVIKCFFIGLFIFNITDIFIMFNKIINGIEVNNILLATIVLACPFSLYNAISDYSSICE